MVGVVLGCWVVGVESRDRGGPANSPGSNGKWVKPGQDLQIYRSGITVRLFGPPVGVVSILMTLRPPPGSLVNVV